MTDWHLAQVNIGRTVAPLEDEQLRGFVEQLEPINALADAAPGFVWRLQTDDGDATALRFGDDLLVNLSVWTSIEALADYVYRSAHVEVMRQRRKWFVPMREAFTCLWWVPAGTVATIADAEVRLAALVANGPSEFSFTFREPFAVPGAAAPIADPANLCPA
jgi:hypothetical protein